jgi:hypothetical protein
VQRLAQQALGQHAVQVPAAGLDLLEHRLAVRWRAAAAAPGVSRLVAPGLGLDLVQLADQLDEARGS